MKRAGGEFEMFNISETLREHGIVADLYGPFSRDLEHYDVVLHFSVHGGGLELLRHIKNNRKPIVLFPNVWLSEAKPHIEDTVNEYVNLSDVIAFKSNAEHSMFEKYFMLPASKVRHISTIADAAYMRPAPKGLFKSVYNVNEYLIGVGIIEPVKNQLAVIKALKNTDHKLVLVGSHRDAEYYAACQAAGGEQVMFIKALPARSELIRSALSESQAFVECSHEPPGLSAIEAGLAAASLVLSNSPWSEEHFSSYAEYCDSGNPESIINAIERAISHTSVSKRLTQDHLRPLCEGYSIHQLVTLLEEACR